MTPGADVVAPTRRAHYLWLDVQLPRDESLAFLANSATSDVPVHERLVVEVDRASDGLSVRIDGVDKSLTSARHVAEHVYGVVHDRVLHHARAAGWVRLHMAMVQVHGRRIGIAGPSGSGKSTAVIAAARRGADVHGDEVVFVRRGSSVALPRPIHLKPGGLALFPEVAAFVRRLDYTPPVYVLDPARLGWGAACNTVGRLDDLVLLDDATSPSGRLQPASVARALAHLMPDAAAFNRDHDDLVREVSALLGSTRLVTLRRGAPDAMASAIESLAR